MISASDLIKSFGDTRVLTGVNLEVAAGELVALLGPNGSGKTTMVRILTTLLAADAGSATVGGHDVAGEPAAVRRAIGLTAQHATVDVLLTGRENLELFAGLYHMGRGDVRRRVGELLERFDLVDAAKRRVATYSGGMRRRLDLAASMIAEPRILFLDEPTTGLDPRSRAELWTVIRELLASGTTILLTTQHLEEADQLANRIAVIHSGRIVADDTPAALKRQVGSERLLLRLARADDIEHASSLLSTDPGREMTIPLHDTDHLRSVLNRLHDAHIDIEHIQLRTPTLDDVFFELTRAVTV